MSAKNTEKMTYQKHMYEFLTSQLESGETLISPIVKAKPVPVRKMAGNILTFVREKKKASVVTLLAGSTTRGELVASFIALLELIKQKVLLLCETEEQAERGDIDYSISLMLNPDAGRMQQTLLDKHYLRKHGANAYYGQG